MSTTEQKVFVNFPFSFLYLGKKKIKRFLSRCMGVRYPTDLCQNISSPHAIVLRSSRCKLKTEREESKNLFEQLRWSRNLNMTKIVISALFSFYM